MHITKVGTDLGLALHRAAAADAAAAHRLAPQHDQRVQVPAAYVRRVVVAAAALPIHRLHVAGQDASATPADRLSCWVSKLQKPWCVSMKHIHMKEATRQTKACLMT